MNSDSPPTENSEPFPQLDEATPITLAAVVPICNACGSNGEGNYCSVCGNDLHPKRITIGGMFHEVFHFFTHLDKGFPFTLKSLLKQPGRMQREYVEGIRSRHQKPFSMFFICLTIAAVSRYWIFKSVYAGDVANDNEIVFFDKYMVLFHLFLLPINAMITHLFFLNSRFNYAEKAILTLYTISLLLLLSVVITSFKFFWYSLIR